MYTVYGFPLSRTSRVIWTLAEIGADFELVKTMPHSDTAYAVNPAGKLPVLKYDDQIIIDSTAICSFLADKHFDAGLTFRQGSLQRAQLESWIQFAINDLEAPLWVIAKHTFVLPEQDRIPGILDLCEREWQAALDNMAKRLGAKPYVMGEQFTVADIILGQIGGRWAKRRNMIIDNETLNQYFDRVCARPAIIKALEYEQQQSTA